MTKSVSKFKGGSDWFDGTIELNRQFPFYPKALHPQMESLVAFEGETEPIAIVASCGFLQLAMMDDVPDCIAEEAELSRFAFRCPGLISICANRYVEKTDNVEAAILDAEDSEGVQKFLATYTKNVMGIASPLVIKFDPTPTFGGRGDVNHWFSYAFALMVGVERAEWEKLFELKMQEIHWASRIKLREDVSVQLVLNQVLDNIRH